MPLFFASILTPLPIQCFLPWGWQTPSGSGQSYVCKVLFIFFVNGVYWNYGPIHPSAGAWFCFFFALVAWDIAIFSYPLLRWSRKKTVFNAWLVAIAGALIPQYIWTFFCYPPDYTLNAFWTMNAGYAIAWIIEQAWRRSIRIEEERRAQKHDAASRQ